MQFITKHRLLFEILGVGVVIVGILILAGYEKQTVVLDTAADVVYEAPPPMTEFMAKALEKSTGFQHLVVYTDNGFVPPEFTIKKGEIVRFSNGATRDLWVASAVADSGRLYPTGAGESCGQSAFDSCVSMKPYEFWEFKFDVAGTWSYRNNASSENFAVIRVQ